MKFNGNITLNSLGQSEVQNLVVERVSATPAFNASEAGRLIYNTSSRLYYMNSGLGWVALATGGDAASLQTEVDTLESSLGSAVTSSGAFNSAAFTGQNIVSAASITDAINQLDASITGKNELKELLDVAVGSVTAGQFLKYDASSSKWINHTLVLADVTDVTATAAEVNYLSGVTSGVQGQINTLTTNVNTVSSDLTTEVNRAKQAESDEATARTNADNTLQSNIDLKVSKAGDGMTGNLAMNGNKVIGLGAPTQAADAATKNYVDGLISGLTWLAPVDEVVANAAAVDLTGKADGYRIVDTTANKLYTVTAGALDAGVVLTDGQAFFHKADEMGYVSTGTSVVQFTGTGQVAAGVGLSKTGNQIDVNLGAGISQLPTDEVGVDVLGTGGLFLTVDGAADSTDTAAQLAVKLDGTTLTRSAAGVKVSDSVMTSISDNQTAISNEQSRATTAEGNLQTNIDNEVTRAKAGEKAVNDRVANGYFLYDGASATSHTVAHNIGTQFCNVTVIDSSSNEQIIPQSVVFDSANQLTVTFNVALACKVVVMGLAASTLVQ